MPTGGEYTAPIITAVFAGITGMLVAIGTLIKSLSDNKLTKHRIEELETKVKELTEQVKRQRERNRKLWLYIEKLLNVIKALSHQIREAKLEPCAEPPDWVDEDEG
jgi:seryl-tRNA synthetase